MNDSMIDWYDIPNFEGLYKISNNGEVLSLGNGKSTNTNFKKQKLLSINIGTNGYKKVKLSKDGKKHWFNVHRLVAKIFVLNPNNNLYVNHKDGDKQNNHYTNLEWCSASENIKHAVKLGLHKPIKGIDNKQSKQINQLDLNGELIKTWGSIKEACRINGFNSYGIIKCCKKQKRYKTAYNYKWEYV